MSAFFMWGEMKEKYKKALKSVEQIRPKKFHYGNKTVVVMPSPKQKRDMTDYEYGMNIDERVVKMAASLAERMAISLMREALSINTDAMVDKIISDLSDKIVEAMPEQKTIIQQVVAEEVDEIRKEAGELVFEGAELSIDRAKGLKLHGKVGEKTKVQDNTDDALDMLDNLL